MDFFKNAQVKNFLKNFENFKPEPELRYKKKYNILFSLLTFFHVGEILFNQNFVCEDVSFKKLQKKIIIDEDLSFLNIKNENFINKNKHIIDEIQFCETGNIIMNYIKNKDNLHYFFQVHPRFFDALKTLQKNFLFFLRIRRQDKEIGDQIFSHQTLLFFNIDSKKIQRFDPNGADRWIEMEDKLLKRFTNLINQKTKLNFVYEETYIQSCPNINFSNVGRNVTGYCVVFSALVFQIKMTFPNISLPNISNALFSIMKEDKENFKQIIYKYNNYLYTMSKNMKKITLELNEFDSWFEKISGQNIF